MTRPAPARDRLHHDRTGPPGQPVVLVHGMCGGAWVFEDLLPHLGQLDCVTYDRRGHSRSRDVGAAQDVAVHVADLAGLLDELGLDRPVVFGSSSGAVIALELAARLPERVGGLVLSEPPLFGLVPAEAATVQRRAAAVIDPAMATGGPVAALAAFLDMVAPGMWERQSEARRDAYAANADLLLPTILATRSTLTAADLAGITTPTAVICGDQSPPTYRTITRRLADGLADAELVVIQGAGHASHVDAPHDVAGVVQAMAGRVAG